MQKLYCYVDESGQDTKGKFFLVVVIIQEKQNILVLEKKLEKAERETGKNRQKWNQSKAKIRFRYLKKVVTFKELRGSVFYREYHESNKYLDLIALTIAQTVLENIQTPYNLTVIIDGLNDKEKDRVRNALKKLKIKYRNIRGMKDEQNSLLRLADSIAGFLRDLNEKSQKNSQVVLTWLPNIAKRLADPIS
jgi:hypothetical protein